MQAIPSRFSWRRMSSSSSVSLSVREAVGSSRIRIFMCGRRRTRAISISCCLPMPRFFTLVVGSTESSFSRRIQSPVWEYISFQSRMPPRAISWPMKMFSAVESSGKRFSSWWMTAIPACFRLGDRGEALLPPCHQDFPRVRPGREVPAQHVDERGLARPVLAAQGVDLVFLQAEGDPVQGPHAGKVLGDVPRFQDGAHIPPATTPQTREGPRVRPLPGAACLSCSAWEASWPRERSCRRPRSDGSRRR